MAPHFDGAARFFEDTPLTRLGLAGRPSTTTKDDFLTMRGDQRRANLVSNEPKLHWKLVDLQ